LRNLAFFSPPEIRTWKGVEYPSLRSDRTSKIYQKLGFRLFAYPSLNFTGMKSAKFGLRSASSSVYVTSQLRTEFGESVFSHAGPAAWNLLPPDIRAAANSAMFKKLLVTNFPTF